MRISFIGLRRWVTLQALVNLTGYLLILVGDFLVRTAP